MSSGSRDEWVVSILGQQGMNPVGVGFVVDEKHVITCAHVINAALGRAKQTQDPPGDNARVLVEFPLLDAGEGAPTRRARVSAWSPPPPSGSGAVGGDVAGLLIVGEPLPAGTSPARLLAAGDVAPGTQVAFFGYPGDPPRKQDGAWATTRWRGRIGGGVIQVDADPDSAIRTQPGYSGSPAVIRDGQGDAVAGILQSASPDATMRDARILPSASLAEAWPAVLGDLLVPDCPYPGLSAFGRHEAEKGYFVGRENEVNALLGMLEAEPMVVVVGPSGVGKSSLVGAGLIPEYERRGWRVLMFRPGAHPFSALARVLLRVQQPEQAVARDDRRRLSEELQRRDLAEIAEEVSADADQGLLIVVDQLEEMLAAGSAEERALFIERAFPAAGARPGNWRLVVTLRADFYPALLAHAETAPRLQRRELPLSPIGVSGMIRAIEEPAARVGVRYAEGLAEQIAQDAGQGGGGLPLLEFTLAAIWPNQRGRMIGFAEYLSSGGVTGALNRHADEWLARHGATDADRVRRVLLKLLRSRGGASAATRRTAPRTDFTEEDWRLVQELAVQRLVVLDQDREGTETAELAHEALVRSWSQLARWVDDDADFQQWLATAEERAAQGEAISENRLEEATRWVAERRDDVPDHIRQFVAESQRRRDESVAREHQRQLAIRVSESLRLAMQARESLSAEPETALLVAFEGLLWDRNELTEAVFRDALDRMPAPVRVLRPPGGMSRRVGCTVSGIIFSPEGDRQVRTWDRDGQELEPLPISSTNGEVTAMPNLDVLLSFADGVFYAYDLGDGVSREITIPDAPRPPYSAFEPVDIRPIGVADVFLRVKDNGWVLALDPETRQPRVACPLVFCRAELGDEGPGHSAYDHVYESAASMSGQRILTLGHDATARLWSAAGTQVAVLEDIDDRNFASGAFLRDDVVVTGTQAGRGQLWTSDGEPGVVFREPAVLDLFVVAVHPDGDSFAVRTNDSTGTLEVWSRSGDLISRLAGHTANVRSAAFSPDGRYLASGSGDCSVRVWDWRDGRQILELSGHTNMVREVTFSPADATSLLSTDFDGSIRQWSLDRSLFPALSGHRQGVRAMYQAGSRILTRGSDGATRLWRGLDLQAELGGELLAYVPPRGTQAAIAFTHDPERDTVVSWLLPGNGDESPIRQGEFPQAVMTDLRDQDLARRQVAMSPDASRVIIQGGLWSLSGEHLARLVGPNDSVTKTKEIKICGTGFQPGGQKMVTASENGMMWFWAADGSLVASVVADWGSPDAVFGIAIDPLGEYVAVGVREKTSLWSWDGEELYRLPTAGYKVQQLSFAPDGSRLITVASPWPESPRDAWVELWPRSGQKIVVDTGDNAWPGFDPSSRYFYLNDRTAVRIFDLDGEPLGTLAGPFRTGVTGIAVSADGNFIAASFTDGVARIWSLVAGRRLTALRIGPATGIVFSPDNQRLLAASPDGRIHQHAVSIEELIPAAAHRLDRVLTRDERTRFSIQDPVRLDLNTLRRMRQENG